MEPGIRLELKEDCNGPRYVALPGIGAGRLYVCNADLSGDPGSGSRARVVSAITSNGLDFTVEAGHDLRTKNPAHDGCGLTAAEPVPPASNGGLWRMYFSAWQDLPLGNVPPLQ